MAFQVDRRKGDLELPLMSVSQYHGVRVRADFTEEAPRAEDLSNYKVCRKGEIVVNRMSAYQGALGVSPVDGLVSPDYMVLRLRTTHDARFWEYLMRSGSFVSEMSARVRGVGTVDAKNVRTPRIGFDELKLIDVPTLSFTHERAIADFLDRETAKIDALIEKQHKLIGLLRERRESVIESVLRNAGQRGALGFFTHCLPGYAFAAQDFSQDDQDVRLLRGINVKPRATDWTEVVYWPKEAAGASSNYQLAAGDIVLGMDRPFVGDGTRVAVIDEGDLPCLLLQRVMRMRPRAQVSSKFLYLALMTRSFREYATPEFTGVSVPHISDKQVRSFRLPVPDLEEQEDIAARVDSDVTKINNLIAKAEAFITLAQERRAALITAAATGQIDVSEGAS